MTIRASLQRSFAGIVGAVSAVLLALALAPMNAWAAAPEGIPEDLPTDLSAELYNSSQVVPGSYVPGTYRVTANWYVWKDNNPLGLPVTAFMTNPNNPFGITPETENMLPGTVVPQGDLPSNPVKNNATLVVGEDGSLTLTVPILNPVFTLEDVSRASVTAGNAAIIDYSEREGAYPHDGTPQFTKRINELTFSLGASAKTSAGVYGYTFAPCGIFGGPSSGFNAYADKPMELSVNFENVDLKSGWAVEDGSWRYYTDGVFATGWQQIGGSWYYFGIDGLMYKGVCNIDGTYSVFADWGGLQYGWCWVDGTYYYANGSGYCMTGWNYINGAWYYMNEQAEMLTGWQQIGDTWYLLNGSGSMYTGWYWNGSTYLYLDGSGAMSTGWDYINGYWYYFDGSGYMQYGWEEINGTWYHFSGSGAMDTGWYWNGSSYLYLDDSGAMSVGWDYINGYWYYFNGSGYMLTGWQVIDGADYYFYGDGSMARSTWIGSYYLGSSGAMLKDTTTPDGYQVDAYGKWVA